MLQTNQSKYKLKKMSQAQSSVSQANANNATQVEALPSVNQSQTKPAKKRRVLTDAVSDETAKKIKVGAKTSNPAAVAEYESFKAKIAAADMTIPANAYNLFMCDQKRLLRSKFPDLNGKELNNRAREAWKNVSKEERQRYTECSKRNREEFSKKCDFLKIAIPSHPGNTLTRA